MSIEFRIVKSLAELDAWQWNSLHSGENPFLQHAFLSGLESTGCLRDEWGWTPWHPTLWDGNTLIAAAPGYLKSNSHGEFVFDHAWADAYFRSGRDYYPKWLIGIPYSPVGGPRLLAGNPANARRLADALCLAAADSGLSSVHVNFHHAAEEPAFDERWCGRHTVQFHWQNSGWADFEAFLAALQAKKRKNIRQERAKVAAAGYRFRIVHGDEAHDHELEAMHRFYLQTFTDYGNSPALTLEFFHHLAATMPRSLVLILAERDGEIRAGALCLRGADTLYGRYWGCAENKAGLHFETCYYQGIDYCLREGLQRFEPGAQGEHKIARGFLPTYTHSHHWLADRQFAGAIKPWCAMERSAMQDYCRQAQNMSPYR